MAKPSSDNFQVILNHLEQSIHAEQFICSIVTEMKYMPPFKNQIALKKIHKENYQTSYHRNTADGNLKRLISGAGQSEHQLVLMTVECFLEADEHDQNIEDALQLMSANTTTEQS